MLNLKKGLALVLAAATAFTFAPVSTFAESGDPAVDGLTATTGIDSISFKSMNVKKGSYSVSDAIHLKEHNDTSYNGTKVGAFKITIDRKLKAGSKTDYEDVVQLAGKATGLSDSDQGLNTTTGSAATTYTDTANTYSVAPEETTPGGTENSRKAATVAKTIAQRTYVIQNAPSVKDVDNLLHNLGGVDFYLYNNGVAGTVNVTVASLASQDSNTVLDSTTFSVTVPSGATEFALQKSDVTVTEDGDVQIPFTITNPTERPIEYLYFTDNTDVASATATAGSAGTWTDLPSDGHATIAAGQTYGIIKVHGNVQGVTTIKVHAYQDSDHEIVTNLKVTVKAGNGKLAVTYNVQTSRGTEKMTYTDNVEYNGSGNSTIVPKSSITEAVEDGAFRIGTKLNTVKEDGVTYLADKDGKVIKKNGSSEVYNKANVSDYIKSRSDLTNKDTVSNFYYVLNRNIGLKGSDVLPSAETLYSDGQKTVQITADATAGSDIRYSLVAETEGSDSDLTYSAGKFTTKSYGYGSDPYSALNNRTNDRFNIQNDGKNDVVTVDNTGYSPRYKRVFSEAAAKKYGAIDKNGLVTLKDADTNTQLYVVVSAIPNKEQADAGQSVSTYVIPINLSVQNPVQFYVSDSLGYVELESRTNTGNVPLKNTRSDANLYLSLADKNGRKSDKLNIVSNIGDSYIKGYSTDTSVATYDDATRTVTAVKKGEADIVIKTSSNPDYAGIITATIHVVVNDLDSSNAVSLTGVSVNKDKPTAKIAAKAAVDGTNIVFSSQLYKADNTRPSGYSAIWSSDKGFDDVDVTSTGNVIYNKNSGTVYVRAYAQGDEKHNPSTWAYVPVNYGQEVVDTELTVDTQPIILDVNAKKQISAKATSGASISYTSADPTVASVTADGTVTANKSGYTTVTVTATAADGKTGDSAVITVIVKGSETITDDTVKKPSKVTGVKVTNLKGGKVKVTWTKQNQKNIKYYVKKTVGKKSAGKSVGSNKTTLSVKKGATVKVKVKAYIYDATGKKLVGSYSKTITKKTDKK